MNFNWEIVARDCRQAFRPEIDIFTRSQDPPKPFRFTRGMTDRQPEVPDRAKVKRYRQMLSGNL
ncbi:hypothetical protein [Nitrospira sp.]|uniref:hypothetical protein n=1 Tax=Nitrospira sp. TaxID=70125 RepID=UPI003FCC4A05